jgi:hypothetical protein
MLEGDGAEFNRVLRFNQVRLPLCGHSDLLSSNSCGSSRNSLFGSCTSIYTLAAATAVTALAAAGTTAAINPALLAFETNLAMN